MSLGRIYIYILILGFRVGKKGGAKRLARTRTYTFVYPYARCTHAYVVRWTPAVVGATTLNLREVRHHEYYSSGRYVTPIFRIAHARAGRADPYSVLGFLRISQAVNLRIFSPY